MKHLARVLPLSVLLVLASCGGGGNGSRGDPQQNASPGGIWDGSDSANPLPVTGVIDESGNLRFIRSDGLQYVGTVVISGTSFSANIDGYMPLGTAFPDGSTHESATVTGTIDPRVSITASDRSMTDKGTVNQGTLTLSFNSLYNQGSSLAAIAGNYADAGSGTVVSIASDGALFFQDASTGCVVNGNLTIINASYDAYGVRATYASCTGAWAAFNGIAFQGLATLNTSLNPAQVIIALTGSGGGTTYPVVYTLNHE